MPRAYWITTYRAIHDPDALAAYAKLALPALTAAGGRVLVRGMPAKVYDLGLQQRVVIFEFDSAEQAVAAHDSPAYQEALRVLGNGVERDLRNNLLQQSKELGDQMVQRHEEVSSLLERRFQELRQGKTDRAALASLFSEVALRLNDQFQIPGAE